MDRFTPSMRSHGIAAAAALVSLGGVNAALNALYAASNHPVDYRTGQTSFDGQAIKEWYATMIEAGTLDTYVVTQLFDFVFIAAVIGVAWIALTFFARIQPDGSWSQRMARRASVLVALGAGFDIIENLISFVMLAMPTTFPDWLAVPYSGVATIKFALIFLGVLSVVASALGWLLSAVGHQAPSAAAAL